MLAAVVDLTLDLCTHAYSLIIAASVLFYVLNFAVGLDCETISTAKFFFLAYYADFETHLQEHMQAQEIRFCSPDPFSS